MGLGVIVYKQLHFYVISNLVLTFHIQACTQQQTNHLWKNNHPVSKQSSEIAKVIGCDIHWRNYMVSAVLPVPSVGQFENYCAVILCTILLHLTHWLLMLICQNL
jgi:hypothetical protein